STSNFLYATPPHASLCRRRSGRRWPTSTTAIVTASFRLMRTMHRLLKECETGVGNTTLFLHLKHVRESQDLDFTANNRHFHLVLVHISEAFTYIQACHMPPARSSAQTILPECPKERYLLYFNPTIAY
ncbi:hypothetical protein B0H10DRAFT_1974257, partial [Mycena sp. CBHHK59/15]